MNAANKSPGDLNAAVQMFTQFYDLYLLRNNEARRGSGAASGVEELVVRRT